MKERRSRLSIKLALVLVTLVLVVGAAITAFSFVTARNAYKDFYAQKVRQITAAAAALVDGDRVLTYLDTGETDAYYDELYRQFQSLKMGMDDLWFLYIMVPELDHWTYVLDAMLPEEDPANFSVMGAVYDYDSDTAAYIVPILESNTFAYPEKTKIISTDIGTGIEEFAPIYNAQGRLVALVGGDISIEIINATMNRYLIETISIALGIVLIILTALLVSLRRMISRPLRKLTDTVVGFVSDGKLAAELRSDIHTGDELELLSDRFQEMAQDIVTYTQTLESTVADRERMSTELSVAANMQVSMLPKELPAQLGGGRADVQGFLRASKDMGGDFFDYFCIENRWLCFLICDVQARGISAAMLLVITKTIIKSQFLCGEELDITLGEVNRQIFKSIGGDIPVNAFVGVLDTETGGVRYINAGYPPPLLMRRGGRYEPLTTPTVSPLGVSENVTYRQLEMTMHQGDRLFMYSDGVTAAADGQGKPYGDDSLRMFLNGSRSREMQLEQLLRSVDNELRDHTGGVDTVDDVTMLALEYRKGDRENAELTLDARLEETGRLQDFLRGQLNGNNVSPRITAQMLVISEELFSLCCRRGRPGERVVARFALPAGSGRLQLVFSADLGGTDPFKDEKDAMSLNAASFIRKVADGVTWACEDGQDVLTVTKTL